MSTSRFSKARVAIVDEAEEASMKVNSVLMSRAMATLCKRLTTKATRVRFLVCMCSHVCAEVADAKEFVAVLAGDLPSQTIMYFSNMLLHLVWLEFLPTASRTSDGRSMDSPLVVVERLCII